MDKQQETTKEEIFDKIAYCKDNFILEQKEGFVNVKCYWLLKNYHSALLNANKGSQEFDIYIKLKNFYENCYFSLEEYKELLVDLDSYIKQVFILLASSQKVKVYYGRSLCKLRVPREQYKGYIANKKAKKEK